MTAPPASMTAQEMSHGTSMPANQKQAADSERGED
jgi:hypothetical protein